MTTPSDTAPQVLTPESLSGVSGGERYTGGYKDEILGGTAGADQYIGDGGNDTMMLKDGADEGYGGDGNDNLQGGGGHDTLYGNAGHDFLAGGEGNDELYSGDGNDTVYLNHGEDTVYGGAGDDTFVWNPAAGGGDVFEGGAGSNVIALHGPMVMEAAPAGLSSTTPWQLVNGRIVFDGPASGTLTIAGQTLTFSNVATIQAWTP